MTTTSRQTKALAGPTAIHELSQQDAAKLIGKPSVWLRDNAHLFRRNADGKTYDGPQVVQAMMTQVPTPTLPDTELEPLLQMAEAAASGLDVFGWATEQLEQLRRRYGTAGLALFGEHVLAYLVRWRESTPPKFPSPEEIEQQEQFAAKRRVASRLEGIERHNNAKLLQGCERCTKYRLGRSWHRPPAPAGYTIQEGCAVCPQCLSK